eukprot:Tamp_22621.p2 GENE.Tamp_22621~~Tamp_22621.p2  ORF type:complete len:125 (+),score=5.75 Tamp_22621:572-946(+)
MPILKFYLFPSVYSFVSVLISLAVGVGSRYLYPCSLASHMLVLSCSCGDEGWQLLFRVIFRQTRGVCVCQRKSKYSALLSFNRIPPPTPPFLSAVFSSQCVPRQAIFFHRCWLCLRAAGGEEDA